MRQEDTVLHLSPEGRAFHRLVAQAFRAFRLKPEATNVSRPRTHRTFRLQPEVITTERLNTERQKEGKEHAIGL